MIQKSFSQRQNRCRGASLELHDEAGHTQIDAHGQHVRGDATQTTFEYISTDYRLDKYSNVCCVAVFSVYRSRPACSSRCNANTVSMCALSLPHRSLTCFCSASMQRKLRLNMHPQTKIATQHIRSFSFATLSPATEKLGVHLFSRVGACGRRPLESADPAGVRVGPYERHVSKLVVLDRV